MYPHFTVLETSANDIPGVPDIVASCTQYAAQLVVKQVQLANKVDYSISVDDKGNTIVQYKESVYTVNSTATSCSCSFMTTLGIPCRHIIKVRLSKELPVADMDMVGILKHTNLNGSHLLNRLMIIQQMQQI